MVTSIPTLSGCIPVLPFFFSSSFHLVQGALNFRKFKRRLDRIPIYKIRLNVLYIRRFCNYSMNFCACATKCLTSKMILYSFLNAKKRIYL